MKSILYVIFCSLRDLDLPISIQVPDFPRLPYLRMNPRFSETLRFTYTSPGLAFLKLNMYDGMLWDTMVYFHKGKLNIFANTRVLE